MRISDWSSDVCSSDLRLVSKPRLRRRRALTVFPQRRRAMPKMIFVNLPVADVERSTAFYEAIGFEKNAKFSNEQASSMVWSDSIVVMMPDKTFSATFTPKRIAATPEERRVGKA